MTRCYFFILVLCLLSNALAFLPNKLFFENGFALDIDAFLGHNISGFCRVTSEVLERPDVILSSIQALVEQVTVTQTLQRQPTAIHKTQAHRGRTELL